MFWPFKKKKKKFEPPIEGATTTDNFKISNPSLNSGISELDLQSPTRFEILREDNGYTFIARGMKGSKKSGHLRREVYIRLVFNNSKDTTKQLSKFLDKLEDEIKIEKLKQ